MHPVLFTLPLPGRDLEVSSYRAAYMLAATCVVVVATLIARRLGLPARRSLAAVLIAGVALPVGARLWHIGTNPSIYAEDPSRAWSLAATGHALFGGVLAASIAGALAARALGLDLWRLADASAPALGLGIAIMRVGCFANGCCFGVPTDAAWGVTFPAGGYSHLWQIAHDYVALFDGPLPVHPTQLYELAGALTCAAVAGALLLRHATSGVAFLTFVGLFAVVRAANWAVRVHPDTLSAPHIYWLLYPATVMACAALIRWRVSRARREESGS